MARIKKAPSGNAQAAGVAQLLRGSKGIGHHMADHTGPNLENGRGYTSLRHPTAPPAVSETTELFGGPGARRI